MSTSRDAHARFAVLCFGAKLHLVFCAFTHAQKTYRAALCGTQAVCGLLALQSGSIGEELV